MSDVIAAPQESTSSWVVSGRTWCDPHVARSHVWNSFHFGWSISDGWLLILCLQIEALFPGVSQAFPLGPLHARAWRVLIRFTCSPPSAAGDLRSVHALSDARSRSRLPPGSGSSNTLQHSGGQDQPGHGLPPGGSGQVRRPPSGCLRLLLMKG